MDTTNDTPNVNSTDNNTSINGDAVAITIAALTGGMPYDATASFMDTIISKLSGINTPVEPEAKEEVAAPEPEKYEPVVSARKSLASKDQIISMIDGKGYKTLRRHLSTHGLTPEQYRERYNLKADYPMVAETYSETRRQLAHKIGLGRKAGQSPKAAAPKPRKNAKQTESASA